MRWWKKLIFSVISLIWGYVSLDYLYYAFSKLTDAKGIRILCTRKRWIVPASWAFNVLFMVFYIRALFLVNKEIVTADRYSGRRL